MSLKPKDPATELSKRMLSGWTLLGDTCALGCNVPLVENKRQKVIECVSCGAIFNRDGDNMVLTSSPQTNKEAPSSNKTTPTAPAPAPAPIQSKVPEDFDEEDEDLLPPPLTAEELAQMEERRKRNDKTSKIMGEKLLAGWTMLSDACPKPDCYQPLMRDLQKQMWCLGCNTMVIRQEDFDPTKHTLVNGKSGKGVDSENSGNSGNIKASSSSVPPSPSDNPPKGQVFAEITTPKSSSINGNNKNNNNNNFDSARQRLYDQFSSIPTNTASFTQHVPSLNFHSAHTHQINPENTLPSTSVANSQQGAATQTSIMGYAHTVLQTKIHELSVMLSQATHPEHIRAISAALKECGLAVSALSFTR